MNTFVRISSGSLIQYPKSQSEQFNKKGIYVLPSGTASDDEIYEGDKTRSGMIIESNELLYSYDTKSCLLATLVVRKGDNQVHVMLGFRDHLPWCSIIIRKDLGISESRDEKLLRIFQEMFDKTLWLSRQSDRASTTLENSLTKSQYPKHVTRGSRSDLSTVTATFRVSVPTTTNPNVFNLLLTWTHQHPEHRLVSAPNDYIKRGPTLFLSGSIDKSKTTWQSALSESLSHLPITILNPHRPDWDSSWRETLSFSPFTEQTNWELDAMEKADVIAFWFGANSQAPVTLMELGLFAGSGKCVVACPEGYWKRGNVQVVCGRAGIPVLSSVEDLQDAIIRMLRDLGKLG
ncbi:hypothetical protein HYALB_00007250 [Hymenoscyphus albidus]|uniref:Uncharacterized protein n=1 Tax=Hymenoscyphus albidus TaxID=595503 RepID=A0A9N9LFX9_9HELO|nr:hypothetical protein HYALB_00007250 [Hymenoscyphus albidus]